MRNSSARLIVLIAAMLLVAVFAGGSAVAEKKRNAADAIAFAVPAILSAADVPDPEADLDAQRAKLITHILALRRAMSTASIYH